MEENKDPKKLDNNINSIKKLLFFDKIITGNLIYCPFCNEVDYWNDYNQIIDHLNAHNSKIKNLISNNHDNLDVVDESTLSMIRKNSSNRIESYPSSSNRINIQFTRYKENKIFSNLFYSPNLSFLKGKCYKNMLNYTKHRIPRLIGPKLKSCRTCSIITSINKKSGNCYYCNSN